MLERSDWEREWEGGKLMRFHLFLMILLFFSSSFMLKSNVVRFNRCEWVRWTKKKKYFFFYISEGLMTWCERCNFCLLHSHSSYSFFSSVWNTSGGEVKHHMKKKIIIKIVKKKMREEKYFKFHFFFVFFLHQLVREMYDIENGRGGKEMERNFQYVTEWEIFKTVLRSTFLEINKKAAAAKKKELFLVCIGTWLCCEIKWNLIKEKKKYAAYSMWEKSEHMHTKQLSDNLRTFYTWPWDALVTTKISLGTFMLTFLSFSLLPASFLHVIDYETVFFIHFHTVLYVANVFFLSLSYEAKWWGSLTSNEKKRSWE